MLPSKYITTETLLMGHALRSGIQIQMTCKALAIFNDKKSYFLKFIIMEADLRHKTLLSMKKRYLRTSLSDRLRIFFFLNNKITQCFSVIKLFPLLLNIFCYGRTG